MLVRAARRKVNSAAIRNQTSFDQLYLPFLYPAQTQTTSPLNRRRWVATEAKAQRSELRRRRNSNDASKTPSRRSMATAVHSSSFDDIPFEGFNIPPPSSQYRPQRNYVGVGVPDGFHSFDPMNYEGLATSSQKIRASKNGITGELNEILSVYYACLQVGRIERAGVILKRIFAKSEVSVEETVTLHTEYLRASVEQIMISPIEAARQAIHKWFELEIRLKRVPYHSEMIAYMLKASLYSPTEDTGGNMGRLVKRYMGMVDGEAGLEVLSMHILTAKELNQVNHICPTHDLAASVGIPMQEEMEIFEKESEQAAIAEGAVPDVLETTQKGLGLKSLKKALSLFSSSPSQGLAMAGKTRDEQRDIQAQLEQDAVDSAIDRWREESKSLKKMGLDSALQTKSIGARMWKWQEALQLHLKEELVKLEEAELSVTKTAEEEERCVYGPFLRILPVEKLAATTILSTMGMLGSTGADKGILLARTIMSVAGNIEDESVFTALERTKKSPLWSRKKQVEIENIKKLARSRGAGSAAKLVAGMEKGDNGAEVTKIPWKAWPVAMKAKVGAYLLSALIAVAKVPVTIEHQVTKELVTQLQPALSHAFQYRMGKKFGVIIANIALVDAMKREPVHSLLAKHLPMLVEPEPWTLFDKGGFIIHPSKLLRVKDGSKDQRHYAEAALGQGDMTQLCEALDVLGRTEWRINKPVFEIMLAAWNSGEAVGNIAPENPNLVIPQEPVASEDPMERRRWIREVKMVENQRTGFHSQRCFQNFQLEIARALRNESFYFPHNMDFRGRAYPIPPYLNHMGADHCRGLLRFGKGRELGKDGLRWVKIHLANVYGFDKASLSEREEFANQHLSEIRDSASSPLDGSKWWLNAEDPWQCLAACIELKNALDAEDPTRFVSHLPVHQDGTCNGLQHYAALGGDLWGAQQVNLEPGDRPADVYTAVADMVKESIARDKLEGNAFAEALDGKITRKTVKQTVMTNVYGVTFVGAREQVKKQLLAAYPDLPNTKQVNPQTLASYIAHKIFTALGSMFRGAHDIQFWFGECAGRISKSLSAEQLGRLEVELANWNPKNSGAKKRVDENSQFRSTVIWTTPLNMPVVQPYRVSKTKSVTTTMQAISLSEPHRTDAVSKRKQLQGFPPNFIHSLDATHMLLSALKSDQAGLSFAAVHDSFWTHAADIDQMNVFLRDSFIKIHQEDVIGRLAAEFDVRHKGSMYLAQIVSSSPTAKRITAWRKENPRPKTLKALPATASNLHEVILEHKRSRLLKSTNPEEIEEGRAMVTPASIFAEMSRENDLAQDPEVNEVVMGSMSSGVLGEEVAARSEVSEVLEMDEGEPTAVAEEAQFKEHMSSFERSVTDKVVKKAKSKTISVWLPLTFPPQPKKGDFDVTRLRDSQYFFS